MADTHQNLRCPACNKEMKKVFVPKEGVNVDICLDGCGGIWFDNRELNYFDEQDESVEDILNSIKDKTFESVEQSNNRSCPVCGARMVKNFTSAKRQIQMDECYSCGGKFLDNQELQKMREEYPTEEDRSKDVLAVMYSTVGKDLIALQKQKEECEKKRSGLKKLFDSIVYSDWKY